MATRTRTRATAPAKSSDSGRKVAIGTLFETSNEDFMAGPISPETTEYKNNQQMLDLLGEPAEGHQWRLKAFIREVKGGKQVVDVVCQEDPIYQR